MRLAKLNKLSALAVLVGASFASHAETVRVVVKPVAGVQVSAKGVGFEVMSQQVGLPVTSKGRLFGENLVLEVEAPSKALALASLERSGQFEKVALDYQVSTPKAVPHPLVHAASDSSYPNDPYYREQHVFMGAPNTAYGPYSYVSGHGIRPLLYRSQDAEPIRVGVVDGGFVKTADVNWGDRHLDFVDIDEDVFFDAATYPACENSHGLGVAMAMASVVNNERGIAGAVNNATVHAAVALECGVGYISDAAYAIAALAGEQMESYSGDPEATIPPLSEPVEVINLSLGAVVAGPLECPFYIQEAVDLALSKDILLFAAAGNDGVELRNEEGYSVMLPANCHGVINVAALDLNDDVAGFSNYGDVDVAVRGVDVPAGAVFDFEESVGYWEGTSFSSPLMAGVGAMLKQEYDGLGYDEFMQALALSATAYPDDSRCVVEGDVCGAGFMDAQALFDAVDYLRGNMSLTPVLDDGATCQMAFLDKYLGLDYPVCQHYEIAGSEYAFQGGNVMHVYQVPKDSTVSELDMSEHLYGEYSQGHSRFVQVDAAVYDYYYQSCDVEGQCFGGFKMFEVEASPAQCL